ncbi:MULTISPECIES: MarR family winged helix-turn-helix transcriptional regulator [unclassified Nocardia]|uniref:MarR family winged helix-turn-helix transcriptional regulator n=1 Tax=unclassified Nocardia TaxID=2637762 RepID=UPI0024A83A38|nr:MULTISPECIES: MarR family winged helix-turn-helix transcriptional regulator [unclassified Nocardia]
MSPSTSPPRTADATAAGAWAAYRRMRELVDAAIARDIEHGTGLSLPDFEVLAATAELAARLDCVRVGGLAAHLGWAHSRLSRQLGRMEKRGLIAREPCERDGRGDDVVLVEAGRTALRDATPVHEAAVTRHLTGLLSGDQLAALVGIEAVVARVRD